MNFKVIAALLMAGTLLTFLGRDKGDKRIDDREMSLIYGGGIKKCRVTNNNCTPQNLVLPKLCGKYDRTKGACANPQVAGSPKNANKKCQQGHVRSGKDQVFSLYGKQQIRPMLCGL